jgi:hypothetical protein
MPEVVVALWEEERLSVDSAQRPLPAIDLARLSIENSV